MSALSDAADAFLENRRIAVTGVSRKPEGHGSNAVYQRLKERGYEAFPVNPNADTVEGDPCFASLSAIPDGVDAVVIGTRPAHALDTMKEAVSLGIGQVWMHRGLGAGSVSPEAAAYGREHGVTVIAGACPLMFGATADGGHRFICRMQAWTGKQKDIVA